MEPTLAPTAEVSDFYRQVVDQYASDVQAKLPSATYRQSVPKINDFSFRLHQQLGELVKLDTTILTMLDLQLLIEYWRLLAKMTN